MVDGPQIEIQDAQCCSCQQDDVSCAIFRADDCADRVALCCHCLYAAHHALYAKEQRELFDELFAEHHKTARLAITDTPVS